MKIESLGLTLFLTFFQNPFAALPDIISVDFWCIFGSVQIPLFMFFRDFKTDDRRDLHWCASCCKPSTPRHPEAFWIVRNRIDFWSIPESSRVPFLRTFPPILDFPQRHGYRTCLESRVRHAGTVTERVQNPVSTTPILLPNVSEIPCTAEATLHSTRDPWIP